MKTLSIILILLIPTFGFKAPVTRTVSSSTVIMLTDDLGTIVNTGGNVTFTLSAGLLSGFSCTIYNHGTGNIVFSLPITVANGQTITILPKSASGIEPGIIGNSIRISYDGSVWRGGK
jgi:hypothetical protein